MEFKNITSVDAVEKVPEGATVLGVVDGALKQMPSAGMGGGKQLVFRIPLISLDEGPDVSNATANMTLDEAIALFTACELTDVRVVYEINDAIVDIELVGLIRNMDVKYGARGLYIGSWNGDFYWTETSGFTSDLPK